MIIDKPLHSETGNHHTSSRSKRKIIPPMVFFDPATPLVVGPQPPPQHDREAGSDSSSHACPRFGKSIELFNSAMMLLMWPCSLAGCTIVLSVLCPFIFVCELATLNYVFVSLFLV